MSKGNVSPAPRVNDVMISYSIEDKEIVTRIHDNLEKAGISTWMNTEVGGGADVFTKIGEAVVDCKIFAFVMSESSVQSKFCQDQLALAYVSGKSIFPVALKPPKDLMKLMNNGMKLQLARFAATNLHWDTLDDDVGVLASSMKEEIDKIKEEQAVKDASIKNKSQGQAPTLLRESTKGNLNKSRSHRSQPDKSSSKLEENPNVFWERNFKSEKSVPWSDFTEALLREFPEEFEQVFGGDKDWIMGILHHEMNVENDEKLYVLHYLGFCTIENDLCPLWARIQEQAIESYAMTNVFSMESSVRVQAIENLGKFKSASVIGALRDLLDDKDSNIKAVAAVTLAKTGANDELTLKHLTRCLDMKDRLVREAACLALGALQATEAVDKIADLWRNDIISNVREAAYAALQNIGGEKAERAIRVTQVLEKEIRLLKSTPT